MILGWTYVFFNIKFHDSANSANLFKLFFSIFFPSFFFHVERPNILTKITIFLKYRMICLSKKFRVFFNTCRGSPKTPAVLKVVGYPPRKKLNHKMSHPPWLDPCGAGTGRVTVRGGWLNASSNTYVCSPIQRTHLQTTYIVHTK